MEDLPNSLDALLDSPVQVVTNGITASEKLRQVSYSSLMTFHACPRKYELQKLAQDRAANTSSVTFAYGHAVGAGVQSYIHKQDLTAAYLAAFLAYDYDLLDEGTDSERLAKKSFATACLAIDKFAELYAVSELNEYEVATIKGVPATELSFSIELLDGFKYRGFIDCVLRHKLTGELLVLELKTTGMKYVRESSYKNQSQALSYAIVLDSLAGESQSFSVLYCVYKTSMQEFELMPFVKQFNQKVHWLQSVVMDCELIAKHEADNFFPTHGESCNAFNRDCEFYNSCTLQALYDPNKLYTADTNSYTLEFNLAEIIDHMEN